jgi:hypothetical protein
MCRAGAPRDSGEPDHRPARKLMLLILDEELTTNDSSDD